MNAISKIFLPFVFAILIFPLFGCETGSQKSQITKSDELDTISFDNLSKKACTYLKEQQSICKSVYKIGSYQNWYYDQMTGELTFSDSGIKKLVIDYEEVGSVSEVTNTFLWAWDNPYVEPRVKSEIIKIKEYGLKRNFEKLITPKWAGDQTDGWDMTAIAAFISKAKGAYRVPSTNNKLFSFMIFKNIRWADTTLNARER